MKNKDLIIRICCIVAAFILWLYIANIENPIKTTVIKNVPVALLNKDAITQFNLVELPKQNYYVNITVKGKANEIYSLKASQFKVTADMSAYGLKSGENRIPVEIESYPEDVTVINNGLWVKVELDDLMEKNIPVKLKITGSPKEGFALSEYSVTPSNILVSGPARYVNSVSYADIDIDLDGRSTNIEDTFNVKVVDNFGRKVDYVNIDPSYVKVKVVLENAKKVPVSVKLSSKSNDNFTVKSITVDPEQVEISGNNTLLNKVEELYTEEIDFSSIKDGETMEVLLSLPNGIRVVNGDDKVKVNIKLEQIIEKNMSLNLGMDNLGDEYEASVKDDVIDVKISAGKDNIQNINDSNVRCYVDLNGLSEGIYNLPVLIKTPDFVINSSYNPKSVEVTIKKKNQEKEVDEESSKAVEQDE